MRAARTAFQPDQVTTVDWQVGNSIMWRSQCRHSGMSYIIPDLSHDFLWLPGEMPRILERTLLPFSAPVKQGMTIIGVRFNPAITSIQIDQNWAGWRTVSDNADTRSSQILEALACGALYCHTDRNLEAILSQLNQPFVRIPNVTDQLAVSTRQLRRWTTSKVGLSPKEISRHLRVRRFIEAGQGVTPAERALQAGFYDQPHAANEVRTLTGLTITEVSRLAFAELPNDS